jgi:hypothetical protein
MSATWTLGARSGLTMWISPHRSLAPALQRPFEFTLRVRDQDAKADANTNAEQYT